jgi:hypothetical protein
LVCRKGWQLLVLCAFDGLFDLQEQFQ